MLAAAFLLCDRNFCPVGGSTQTCVLSLVFCSHVVLLGSLRWNWWPLYTSLGPLHSNVRLRGLIETPVEVKDPVWTCGVCWLTHCSSCCVSSSIPMDELLTSQGHCRPRKTWLPSYFIYMDSKPGLLCTYRAKGIAGNITLRFTDLKTPSVRH